MKCFGSSPWLAYYSLEILLPTLILATKPYIPHTRPNLVPRPRLIKQLTEGFCSGGKLTLISTPAGFGKTTLVSDWINHLKLEPKSRAAGQKDSALAPPLKLPGSL